MSDYYDDETWRERAERLEREKMSCSVVRQLGDGWFRCINDSHFADGSHLHYMRRLPSVEILDSDDGVRLPTRRELKARVQTGQALSGT